MVLRSSARTFHRHYYARVSIQYVSVRHEHSRFMSSPCETRPTCHFQHFHSAALRSHRLVLPPGLSSVHFKADRGQQRPFAGENGRWERSSKARLRATHSRCQVESCHTGLSGRPVQSVFYHGICWSTLYFPCLFTISPGFSGSKFVFEPFASSSFQQGGVDVDDGERSENAYPRGPNVCFLSLQERHRFS